MSVKIVLDEKKITEKVTNDEFGKFVSKTWRDLIEPYTPRKEGFLSGARGQTVEIMPFKIWYKEPYAHYQYMGKVYQDPDYKKAAFYDPKFGFWSRPNVKKEETDRPLNYSTKENPYATDHWDEKAAEAGQLDKLYTSINDYLSKK